MSAAKAWVHTAPAHRAQLECTVSADPPASVTWLKEETPVTVYNRVLTMVQGEKYTLVIRNVQPSDFGVYTCRARNSLGQGDVHIQLSGELMDLVYNIYIWSTKIIFILQCNLP